MGSELCDLCNAVFEIGSRLVIHQEGCKNKPTSRDEEEAPTDNPEAPKSVKQENSCEFCTPRLMDGTHTLLHETSCPKGPESVPADHCPYCKSFFSADGKQVFHEETCPILDGPGEVRVKNEEQAQNMSAIPVWHSFNELSQDALLTHCNAMRGELERSEIKAGEFKREFLEVVRHREQVLRENLAMKKTLEDLTSTNIKQGPKSDMWDKYGKGVKDAEEVIIQLPPNHEDRNKWLISYGVSLTARKLREPATPKH